MILFPPAKINLGLNVLHKRPDGFHELETVLMQIPIHDVLEILPSSKFSYRQSGIEFEQDVESNLVVRAYRLLQNDFSIPETSFHLLKNIPVGAGLGGGSADAAYALIGLNTLYNLNISDAELRDISGELGSDCPFFISCQPQIGTGRGEVVELIELDLKGYYLKLIHPGIHISTSQAYNEIEFSTIATTINEVINEPIENWKNRLFNSFETAAFKKYPELEKIKASLYSEGAVYASMTGSGSSLYGIYDKEPIVSNGNLFERVVQL